MPPDSEGNSGLNPSCVSAGEASRESSRLNERRAEDYALMQEVASKFSTRNEPIALIFFFLFFSFFERCKGREFSLAPEFRGMFLCQDLGYVTTFDLGGQSCLLLTFCNSEIQTYNEATIQQIFSLNCHL